MYKSASDDQMYLINNVANKGWVFTQTTYSGGTPTYKNYVKVEAVDNNFEEGMAITFFDEDDSTYGTADLTGAMWTGADSGGSYDPTDLHIGAADDIYFYTSINGTPAARFGMADGGTFWIKDGITAPSSTSTWAGIYIDSADGDLKVIFGDGTVKTIATDT